MPINFPTDDFFDAEPDLDKLTESLAIIQHINKHAQPHEHLVVIDGHEPYPATLHTANEQRAITHKRIQRMLPSNPNPKWTA